MADRRSSPNRERVILSMATDLGLRVSDFLKIEISDLPDLDQEAPISFDVMTNKEDVIAKGFLSKLHQNLDNQFCWQAKAQTNSSQHSADTNDT